MDQAIVIDSVKKMLSSGLDAPTIRFTLLDLGLSEKEADDAIAIAQGKTVNSPPPQPTPPAFATPSDETPLPPKTPSMPTSPPPATQPVAMAHASTQMALDQHQEQLSQVHASVSELHDKVDTLSESITPNPDVEAKLSLLSSRFSALERELTELKAQGNALQSLLSKVLETNRDVLLELQRRN